MTASYTYICTWEPSLTTADVAHLKNLGFVGASIKGNPYRRHLRKAGEPKALCGAAPGSSKGTYKMVDRTGWLLYESFEGPGCRPCEKCLKAVEGIARIEKGGAV